MVSRTRLFLPCLATAVLIVAAALVPATTGFADTAPPNSSTPITVAADALPTPQINGVVWTQLIVGNTVYVGGEFTRARPAGSAPGANEVVRNNVLAYTLSTGVLTSFNPSANATVRAFVASPDGSRLYMGGSFTKIGSVTRYRVAAFSTSGGALVTNWAPVINSGVKALGIYGSTLFVGGSFSSAGGQSRGRIASFSTTSGAVLGWKGNPANGSVTSLVVSPDGSKVVIGGSFTSYNGGNNPGYGMAATSASTGAPLPWKVNSLIRNAGANAAILSLTGSSAGVFGSGYVFGSGGNFEGTFRASWADGTVVWVEDCHGDTYSAVPTANVVYTTGHVHYCGNIGGFKETNPRSWHRTLSFTMNATGVITKNTVGNYFNYAGQPRPTLLAFYPEINTGSYTGQNQGAWHVTANASYVLYGGEFTLINNKRQQGLARFAVSSIAPNKEGPRVSGDAFRPTLSSPSAGSVTVSWTSNYDRDNESLTYQVLRNGVVVKTLTGLSVDWSRPTLKWTETGLTRGSAVSYSLKAIDPFGNTATGTAVGITVAGAAAVVDDVGPAKTIAPDAAVPAPVAPEVAVPDVAVPEMVVPAVPEVAVPEVAEPDDAIVPAPEPDAQPEPAQPPIVVPEKGAGTRR